MPKSYRIRTQVGVDKKLDVNLDQDFEFLEILSLKLSQSELYVRQCSDYGVVVGRVSINNGFGVPNAKLSIFIPITQQDELNPIISAIYPYKTVDDINEDGYKYNLLPYKPSYPGHAATGSFPDLEDVLINPTAIEIYDKYYKFTVTTNDSGDFMIFGVPVGSQTLVMNVDLSDIGPFSLSPQDLIRLGIATDSQVNGTKFKTSENISILPQIITLSKDIIVEPLWGEQDLCQSSITRTDFDLTNELQVEIKPTAIFMGSIFSDSDRNTIKKNCKPRLKAGNMCSLVAAPGQILAIRHTIRQDNSGKPILEVLELENNGNVIDENGTWLLDVPMNLDYIVTNEFGEQIFSNDTKKGIPTKAKYRFKIKWNQTPDLSAPVKRASFLVPNVKEHGWTRPSYDPINDSFNNQDYQLLKSSYAFSLDWNDYGYSGITPNGQQMIQDAIDCKDTFYEMSYNKVYTVSQLITRYTKGTLKNRFSAIKSITDTECDSENYKFPSNDGQYKTDFIFILFTILMFIMLPLIKILVRILHVVARIVEIIINVLEKINKVVKVGRFINNMKEVLSNIANFNLPLYSFPDCEICSCKDTVNQAQPGIASFSEQSNFINNSPLSDVINADSFLLNSNPDPNGNDFTEVFQQIGAGSQRNDQTLSFGFRATLPITFSTADSNGALTEFAFGTFSLPISERINLFNSRAKFFGSGLNTDRINQSQESPLNWLGNRSLGGGVNQIKVCFNENLNEINTNTDFVKSGNLYQRTQLLTTSLENRGFHYDNVVVILTEEVYQKGTLLTFENPTKFNDLNLSGQTKNDYDTFSITGTPINTGETQINVSHTHPITGARLITKYKISGSSEDENRYLRYPTDIEYFQVIESRLVKDMPYPSDDMISNSLDKRALRGAFSQNYSLMRSVPVQGDSDWSSYNAWDNYENKDSTYITILMRGVDPHSTPQPMKIGLGRIFGDQNHWGYTVTGNFKMNIPLQPNDNLEFGVAGTTLSNNLATSNALRCTKHNTCNNTIINDSYAGRRLFHPSYHFSPSILQWKQFKSTSIYNYIATSESDFGSFPISQIPNYPGLNSINNNLNFYSYVSNSNGKGLRIHIDNYFARRGANTVASNGEAGYIPNECVEGIGFMMIVGWPNFNQCSSSDFFCRRAKLTPIYWSRKYEPKCSLIPDDNKFTMNDSQRIVFRSDRLPTSDGLQTFGQNSMGLMTNGRFQIYELPEGGIVNAGLETPAFPFVVNEPEIPESGETQNSIANLLNTFSCGSLVPIQCYKGDTKLDKVTVEPSGTCQFVTFSRDGRDNRTQYFIQGSCYSLVRPPFLQKQNVRNDLDLVNEWFARMNINFGACREVFSHLFVNNWINGTLYMFPFRNTRYFTGINENPPNQPYNKFCKDTVYLHPETFNFYYRSAPYNDTSKKFGRDGTKIRGKTVGNGTNLMYPTTIMDLGPRDELQKFLSQSGNWDGYIMNKLNSTTFGDTSNLLNIFVLSRLANTSFTKFFKSQKGASILNFFNTRPEKFVDADFAQMVATNSQFGISDYDPEDYPEPSTADTVSRSSLYFPINPDNGNRDDIVFGIFYTGDSQSRDYVSPNRIVYDPFGQIGSKCAYSYIPLKTQFVPFYLWEIKFNPTNTNIFGTQSNDWSKNVWSYNYQGLDRLAPYTDTKMYKPNNVNIINYNKGWIYNVDTNVTNSATGEANYSPEPGFGTPNDYNLGAPFYFYFGLKQGASAFDRFTTKWIDTEELVG